MRLQVFHKQKTVVYFWLSHEDSKDELLMDRIKKICKELKSVNTEFVIMESGIQDLENNLSSLLKYNYSLFKDNIISSISEVA